MKRRKALRTIPFLVSLSLICLIFRMIGPSKLAHVVGEAGPLHLSLALLPDLPFILLKSYKWHRMGRVVFRDMRFGDAVSSFLIGLSASLFTPARIGELARVMTFKQERREALVLAFLDKVVDLSGLGFLFLLSLLILDRLVGAAIGIAGSTAFIVFAIWWGKRGKISFSLRLPFSFLALQLLLSLTCFLLLMLQFWVILMGFKVKARFVDVFTGLPLILVGSMLPLSVNGLGLREMVASLILPCFGIDEAQAVTASFLLFLVNSLIPGMVGIAIGGNEIRHFLNNPSKKPNAKDDDVTYCNRLLKQKEERDP